MAAPGFRCVVLANRPGHPFLGNDFFREAGDCFSVHVIANPPAETMLEMLRSYAPDRERVPDHVLTRLVGAFQELHQLYLDETLSYLISCLSDALKSLGEDELIPYIPWSGPVREGDLHTGTEQLSSRGLWGGDAMRFTEPGVKS